MKNSLISIARPLWTFSRRCTVVLFLFVVTALWSSPAQAAMDGKEAAARLLRAELPTGMSIQKADGEQLARAVGRATLAHRTDAPAILSAALTNGSTADVLKKEEKRACGDVTRIVRASIKAAPAQASAVLDVALALYPDCADSLSGLLAEARNALSDEPVAGINNVSSGADTTASGFGTGFGPGFAGAPGFFGRTPSGGAALQPASDSTNQ